jgi:hypothetical protein
MKTFRTFFAIACAVVVSNIFVSAQSATPSRTVMMGWNTETQAWDSTSSQMYQYDNSGRVSVETGYSFANGELFENRLTRYTYNSAGQITEKLEQWKLDGEWQNMGRDKTEYDTQGNQTLTTFESWTDGEWKLVRGDKSEFTYDQNNRITQAIEYRYNFDSTAWEAQTRSVMTYENGKPHTITSYNWTDGEWELYTRMTEMVFLNDDFDMQNTKILSANIQSNVGGIWITTMRMKATFQPDGKELTNSMEMFDFTSGEWAVLMKDSSVYDAQNNLTLKLSGFRNPMDDTWMESGERHTYEYNSDNSIHTDVAEQMSSESPEWVKTGKKVYFYGGITSVETEDNQAERLAVFPNPATENIFITGAEGEFTLFNQLGQVVLKGSIAGENSRIDASNLQIGQYILQINTPKGVQSQKVIITR